MEGEPNLKRKIYLMTLLEKAGLRDKLQSFKFKDIVEGEEIPPFYSEYGGKPIIKGVTLDGKNTNIYYSIHGEKLYLQIKEKK